MSAKGCPASEAGRGFKLCCYVQEGHLIERFIERASDARQEAFVQYQLMDHLVAASAGSTFVACVAVALGPEVRPCGHLYRALLTGKRSRSARIASDPLASHKNELIVRDCVSVWRH